MSPNRREREYARRRYEKWQEKRLAKQTVRQRRRRNVLVALAALAVVAVISGVLWFVSDRDAAPPTAAAGTTPTVEATPSSTAGASPSPSASSADNPCGPSKADAKPAVKSWPKAPPAADAKGKEYVVTLATSCGDITLALDGAKAPQAVASTVFLSTKGFYDKTPCHRLTTEGIFVLQCGDPAGTGSGGPGYSYGPVENAPADNVYPAGTVAMARQGGNATSMGSQFFLVYKDSTIPSDAAGGYTVLGKITGGRDVLQTIADGGTVSGSETPARAVSIDKVTVKDG